MTIRADVFRSDTIFAVFEPPTVRLDQRISSADSVTVEFPAGMYRPLPGDEIDLYDCTDNTSGNFFGSFRVITIETVYGSNGLVNRKLKLLPIAAFLLSSTGTPGENVAGGATLITAADNIVKDVIYLTGQNIQLNFINPDGYPGQRSILAMRRSQRTINAAATTTFLELLNTILVPSDGRWRCRPEYALPTIELGWFGDEKQVFIRSGSPDVVPTNLDSVFFSASANGLIDDDSTVNSLFIEGGTWTGDKGYAGNLVLWHYLNVPDGYAVRSEGYPDGVGHFRIDKLLDENGVGYTWRRSKRVTVGSIVPATTNGMTPDGTQVVAASQQLLEVGVDYLSLHCIPQRSWTTTITTSTLGKFNVGDKVHLTLFNEEGNTDFAGYVFVVSRNTSWGIGKRETYLELSTILESLVDPLSQEYSKVSPSQRSTARQGNYVVTLVCTPDGTYTFSVPGAAVPDIVNVSTNIGAAVITSLTAISVSFTTSGGSGTPATVKVTFTVVPKD